MAAYGEKGLKLFYVIFIVPVFFLSYGVILVLLLPTTCANFKKIATWKKNLTNTRKAISKEI